MSRFESGLVRSIGPLGVCLGLFSFGLYELYNLPEFGEHSRGWLLTGLFAIAAIILWLARPRAVELVELLVAPVRRYGIRALIVLALVATIGFIAVAKYALDAFPNSGDELAFVMQAHTYAHGKLWAKPPAPIEAFWQYRFLAVGGKWVSQYPPGWALVLTPAAALGLPLWIMNPLIGGATLLAFFALARRHVSRESAWIGVLLLGASAFFAFNSGSYFSHSPTALYGIAFALFGLRYIASGEIWCAVAAGLCIGLIGLTRTQNAAIFAVPFAIALSIKPGRRAGLIWFGLGGAPFLVALLAYNGMITGHPLVPVAALSGKEPLGFPSGTSIWQMASHLARLTIWTSPLLLIGYGAGFVTILWRRRARFTDWIFPATVIIFLFYSSVGDNQYGPRYYFEAWPFAILTILTVIDPILFCSEQTAVAAWISSALVTSLLFEIGYLPAHIEREHRVVMERQDVYARAEAAGLSNAIVVIATKVGAIRPMMPGDLVRDRLDPAGDKIIYAHDLGARNYRLFGQFPGRRLYIYSNGRLAALN